MKPSQNSEITLSFTDVGKSCSSSGIFNVANMSFNTICKTFIIFSILASWLDFDIYPIYHMTSRLGVK